jgi:methyl-accepting chemotaxis protein
LHEALSAEGAKDQAMKFRNMRIGVRLALAFFVVMALFTAVAVLALVNMTAGDDRLDRIVKVNNAQMSAVETMEQNILGEAVAVRTLVLLSDQAEMRAELDRIKALRAEFQTHQAELVKLFAEFPPTPTEKALMAKIASGDAAMRAPVDKAIALGLQDKNDEATAVLLKEVRPLQLELQKALSDLSDGEQKLNTAEWQVASDAFDFIRPVMIALTIAAVAAGIVLAWLATRSVTRPIAEALRVAEAVAGGDLTTQVHVTASDETGKLMAALKRMNESLASVVGAVRTGTDAIATASGQIATGNQDLSQRTEEQASSLEETAASMEELTGTVKQNAENARQANQLAESAAEVAVKGGQVIEEVVGTMASIHTSSRKVADIIAVIDGIAFQTNILALNAAVEAARAGEQGRGFAVVASEVRSLAQRSAAAAKEIKSLIDESVTAVDAGSDLVSRAGETMQQVVGSIQRVKDLMGEIAAATTEQTRGIDQVNTAITQLDRVTQQNAALVEEAAAAAQSMRAQAGALVDTVSVFTVGADREAAQVISHARAVSLSPAPRAPSSTVQRPKQLARAGVEDGVPDGWTEC